MENYQKLLIIFRRVYQYLGAVISAFYNHVESAVQDWREISIDCAQRRYYSAIGGSSSYMLEIDGSEGGGQLFRSALALSVVTETAVRITDIRGARSTPGLRPQHVAVAELLRKISEASTTDISTGTTDLEFEPGQIHPGEYEIDIGTAGSLLLLFDSLLPIAVRTTDPLRITAIGGTDVKWAPTLPHYAGVKLPLLRKQGVMAAIDVQRRGFYPKGGGRATLTLGASTVRPFDFDGTQERPRIEIHSIESQSLEENDVSRRQAETARKGVHSRNLTLDTVRLETVSSRSPGSVLAFIISTTDTLAGIDALGEPGKPAEEVAEMALEALDDYLEGGGGIDPHCADQLVLFLAIAGGQLTTPRVTEHLRSHCSLINQFGFDIDLKAEGETVIIESPGTSI